MYMHSYIHSLPVLYLKLKAHTHTHTFAELHLHRTLTYALSHLQPFTARLPTGERPLSLDAISFCLKKPALSETEAGGSRERREYEEDETGAEGRLSSDVLEADERLSSAAFAD